MIVASDHPDAELLRLGHDFELLLQAVRTLHNTENVDVRWTADHRANLVMKAIHRLQPTTVEGFAVKLRAICYDFADFQVEEIDLRNGDVAEIQLGRLMRHARKLARAKR